MDSPRTSPWANVCDPTVSKLTHRGKPPMVALDANQAGVGAHKEYPNVVTTFHDGMTSPLRYCVRWYKAMNGRRRHSFACITNSPKSLLFNTKRCSSPIKFNDEDKCVVNIDFNKQTSKHMSHTSDRTSEFDENNGWIHC